MMGQIKWWLSGFMMLLLQGATLTAHAACSGGTDVGGMIFQELPFDGAGNNTYGLKNPNESGIEGVTVTLSDVNGASHTRVTDGNGAWDSAGLNLDYPVRVEFSWSQSWLKSSPNGGDSATSVQFASASDCNLDFGLYVPADYHAGGLPDYVIPSYVNGDGRGDGANDAALYEAPYVATGLNGSGGTTATQLADVQDLGSVWGVAYHKSNKRLYVSALMKRHVGFANSPGSIYVMDYNGVTPNYLGTFDLQGVAPDNGGDAIDFGNVCRSAGCAGSGTGIASDYELPSSKGSPNIDLDAFSKVGKVAYGDIDMQPDSNYLWAVNLFQRALIRVDVSGNPVKSAPSDVAQYALSGLPGYPSAGSGEMRPWGLGFYEDKGYLGVVNDATSGSMTDLLAYVLEFDPNNIASGFTTVLSFNPNGQRSVFLGAFYPWKDVWTSAGHVNPNPEQDITLTLSGRVAHHAQPILSDIEFDENGDMFISLADRFGHQMGAQNYWAVSGAVNLTSAEAKGDTKKACKTTSGYEFEGSANCPSIANSEFIQDLSGNGTTENAEGASALLKGSRQIMSVSIDPNPAATGAQYMDSQGVMTYGLDDGEYNNWYAIYQNTTVELFDKANGLGDIELLTESAPIEVGNRVWLDTDGDGIQDAGEDGIGGVEVDLMCGGNYANATTDSNGQFFFSNTAGGNASFMTAGQSCTISIDSGQAAIQDYSLTLQDADGKTNNDAITDIRDSDAVVFGSKAQVTFTVGNAGENNHSLDIGFTEAVCSLEVPVVNASCNDGGTASDPSDDTFSYTINLNGANTGASYNIGGDDVRSGLAYGSEQGPFGSFPISGGGISLTLTDVDDAACMLADVTVTAPAACSNAVDVELTKTVDKSSALRGEVVVYTLNARNTSANDATGVQVTDVLPAGVTYTSDDGAGAYSSATGVWNIGDLAAGQDAVLNITVTVD